MHSATTAAGSCAHNIGNYITLGRHNTNVSQYSPVQTHYVGFMYCIPVQAQYSPVQTHYVGFMYCIPVQPSTADALCGVHVLYINYVDYCGRKFCDEDTIKTSIA